MEDKNKLSEKYNRIFNFYREKKYNWDADEGDERLYDSIIVCASERGKITFNGEFTRFNVAEICIGCRYDDEIISDLELLEDPKNWDKNSEYLPNEVAYSRSCSVGGTHIWRYKVPVSRLDLAILLEDIESYKVRKIKEYAKIVEK